jgi:hypothetical protein
MQRTPARLVALAAAATSSFTAPAVAAAGPTVSFKTPTEGAVISGTLRGDACEATVAGASGSPYIDFYVDGKHFDAEQISPYNCTLDTTTLTDGEHTLRAVVRDDQGLTGSGSRTITVRNTTEAAKTTSSEPPAPPPETAMWIMDLDEAPLGPLKTGTVWGAQNYYKPERISVAQDPQGRYGKVMRTETRSGEYIGGDANGSRLRAEAFMPMVDGKQWVAHPGQEFFYGFRFMESAANVAHSITQFKGMNPDSNAYGGFLSTDETHGFRLRFGSVHLWKPSLGGLSGIRGKWWDFVIRVKYGTGSDGLVEVWFGPAGSPEKQTLLGADGKPVGTTYRGQTVFGDQPKHGTNGVVSRDIWLKQGIYGGNAVATNYFSRTRLGKSFSDVVPR